MQTAIVAGVGMTRFTRSQRSLRDLAAEAVRAALYDAVRTRVKTGMPVAAAIMLALADTVGHQDG